MRKTKTRMFAWLWALPALAMAQAGVTGLQVEHLEDPSGVDDPHPRMAWKMDASEQDIRQSACRIMVASDSTALATGQADMWDFREESHRMLHRYAGSPLQPQTTYYWRVAVTDSKGRTATSSIRRFHTGMMGMHRWQGYWISDGKGREHLPAPYFRRGFKTEKPVRSAHVYISAAGLYELYFNGQRVGDQMLSPLYTRFDRRNLYLTHDVTALIRQGDNAMGVILGNGWANFQSLAVWNFENAPWRKRPSFILDLVIQYQDGTTEVIPTDYAWRSSEGPLRFNSIYTGEHLDLGLTQQGWASPGFEEKGWHGISLQGAPSPLISSQMARPIRIDWERKAQQITQPDSLTWVYDFGQNMAGVTRLKVKGPKGTVLRIAHAERLYPDGRIDPRNIDIYYRGDKEKDPFQTDVITLSGEEDEYLPQFNYKGFRYAQISTSVPLQLTADNLTACFMHSDVPNAGTISSSSDMIEKLIHAARMSYLSNLMGIPTDCPQREKNGWTGDGHLAIEAGLYNFDGITVYEKWMDDHRDEQQPNGVLPDIIPTGGWGYGTDNGLDWTSTIAIIPWTLYTFYGDTTALHRCYPHIKRYVGYVERISQGYLTTWGRGDWVPVTVGSNKELTCSVYFYTDALILARAAQLFGYTRDAEYYGQLAENIRNAINDKFLDRETGVYASGTQTEQSVPLCWGVVPEEMQALVAQRLNEKVVAADYHLDVGVLGCRALLTALSQHGYGESAYRIAVQDTYPSWGWWIRNGATTLLENWKVNVIRDGSDNHMMFGEIAAWLYRDLAGICPDEADPGFHHIILRPYFPQGLESFHATHESPYGTISSGWDTKRKTLTYKALVPPNTHATLRLPQGWTTREGETELSLPSGSYSLPLKRSK